VGNCESCKHATISGNDLVPYDISSAETPKIAAKIIECNADMTYGEFKAHFKRDEPDCPHCRQKR
jgi:hypothetical protein